jgi:hypothetical protein
MPLVVSEFVEDTLNLDSPRWRELRHAYGESRLARRKRNWIADVLIAEVASKSAG